MSDIKYEHNLKPTGHICEGEIYLWYIYDKSDGQNRKFLGSLLTDAKDSQPSKARKRASEVTGLPFGLIGVRSMAGAFEPGPELWEEADK